MKKKSSYSPNLQCVEYMFNGYSHYFQAKTFLKSQNWTRLPQKAGLYLITYLIIYIRTYFVKDVVADDWNKC